jgi:hypothetical protein
LKLWKPFLLALLLVLVVVIVGGAMFIHRGFRATNQPSGLESFAARAARNYSIPGAARSEKNPLMRLRRTFRMAATHSLQIVRRATATTGTG